MINLWLNELKLIARSTRNKDYQGMSKDWLLSVLNESESAKSEKNFDNARIKEIKEKFNDLRDIFAKPKIREIRKILYEIENKNNLSTQKIKEIEKNLYELEKNLSKLKKYYDYDDIEYKGIRDIRNLLDPPIDVDY